MSMPTGVLNYTPDDGETWSPIVPGIPGPPGPHTPSADPDNAIIVGTDDFLFVADDRVLRSGDVMTGNLQVDADISTKNIWASEQLGGNNVWGAVEVGGTHGYFVNGASMNGAKLTSVGDPVFDDDGVNKGYVDARVEAGSSIVITAGTGLSGGGSLTADRTIDFVAGDTTLMVGADSVVVNTAVIAPRSYVDTQDATKVNKAGDTMTGALAMTDLRLTEVSGSADITWEGTLDLGFRATTATPGVLNLMNRNFDTYKNLRVAAPVNAQDATTKGYVDAVDLTKVSKTGDTMTGPLTAPDVSVDAAVGAIATQSFKTGGVTRWQLRRLGSPETGGNAGSDLQIRPHDDAGSPLPAALTILRSTGLVTVAGNPTAALGIATKQYVDSTAAPLVHNHDTAYVNTTGDTMTGQLIINAGVGVGIPLLTLYTNAGTQVISSDSSSNTTFSNGISVPNLFIRGGMGFTTPGITLDFNGGNLIQANKLTITGSVGHIRNYSDYNASQAPVDQGIIHTYANRTSGAAPQAAFQVHKAGDITEQPFLISSQGYGWLRNNKVDSPVLTLRQAPGQTADPLRIEDAAGAMVASVMTNGGINANALVMAPDTGTAKGRFGTLPGTEAWVGMFINAQYVSGQGWLLDDPTKPGWFLKVDSRNSPVPMYAVYYIPAGSGYHTDEYEVFSIQGSGLVTVRNRITGLAAPTGATDAATKAYVDTAAAAGPAGGDLTGMYPDPQIKAGVIVDADVNATAGIAQSKIASLVTDLGARVLKAGDTLTGPLILNADPTANLGAVTKQYVDGKFAQSGITQADADIRYVNTTGDTMTGFLTLHANPSSNMQAATKGYVDGMVGGGGPPVGAAGGDLSGFYPNPVIAAGIIDNADISATAAIATSKISGLDTALAGKVVTTTQVIAGNGLTGGGALSGNVTLNLVGDANLSVAADQVSVLSAPKWTTGRTITLTGDVTGVSAAFDGSANLSYATNIAPGVIVDADVNATANIAQSKISGLTTSLTGKVDTTRSVIAGAGMTGGGALSADVTLNVISANTDMTVAADAITINSAPKWTTGRTLALTGDVTGTSPAWDGSGNTSFAASIAAGAVTDAKVATGISQSKIANLTTDLSNRVLKAGDIMSGTLTATYFTSLGGMRANGDVEQNTAAGVVANYLFMSGGKTRWSVGKSNDAESGANAGSVFNIAAWDDAGNWKSNPFSIRRTDGRVTIAADLYANWSQFTYGADFGGYRATGVADPTQTHDAANKQYADTKWTMWTGTQAAYDAITTKDPNTLYAIVEG